MNFRDKKIGTAINDSIISNKVLFKPKNVELTMSID